MAKDAKARKGDDGQEAVIKLESLTKRVDELIGLKRKIETATADYSDAVKVAAEDSGLQASTVRKFITARAGERFKELKRDADQLSLCFAEVGE